MNHLGSGPRFGLRFADGDVPDIRRYPYGIRRSMRSNRGRATVQTRMLLYLKESPRDSDGKRRPRLPDPNAVTRQPAPVQKASVRGDISGCECTVHRNNTRQ